MIRFSKTFFYYKSNLCYLYNCEWNIRCFSDQSNIISLGSIQKRTSAKDLIMFGWMDSNWAVWKGLVLSPGITGPLQHPYLGECAQESPEKMTPKTIEIAFSFSYADPYQTSFLSHTYHKREWILAESNGESGQAELLRVGVFPSKAKNELLLSSCIFVNPWKSIFKPLKNNAKSTLYNSWKLIKKVKPHSTN